MDWLLLYALLITLTVPAVLLFLRWFLEPVRSSWNDPPASSYSPSYTDPRTSASLPFPSLSSPPSRSLSLIIPAYNEEERLSTMMDATLAYLRQRRAASPGFTYELIIVDDGSRDRTFDAAMRYSASEGTDLVRVMRLGRNQGKGGAVQQGMLHARGEWLLMVDADGATRISDVEALERGAARVQRGPDAIAVGSRAHLADDAVATRAWYRNVLMYGFHFLVSSLCVRNIRDTQCGFKLFSRSAAQRLFPAQHLRRWCFDVELLFLAQRMAVPVVEVPVNWQEIPGSKIALLESSLLMGRDLVIIRACYALGVWTAQAAEEGKKSL